MNRTTILTIAICIAITVCITMAVGQNDSNNTTNLRYSVATAGDSAVLVDTLSGKTWLLYRSVNADEGAVWLPISRLDNDKTAERWHKIEKERTQKVRQQVNMELLEAYDKLQKLKKMHGDQHPDVRVLQIRISKLEASLLGSE